MDEHTRKFCTMELKWCSFHSYHQDEEVCCIFRTGPEWSPGRVPFLKYVKSCPKGDPKLQTRGNFTRR